MSSLQSPGVRRVATQLCRELRKSQTRAEQTFWEAVRNRKLLGLKFYRQYSLFFEYSGKETFYIADFFCFERKVVVEIDGKIHDYQKDRDRLRTFIINMLGIEVIRFPNEEVENDLDSVLQRLRRELSR